MALPRDERPIAVLVLRVTELTDGSALDGDAHRAGGARDDLLSGIEVGGVEVLQLGRRDLADLSSRVSEPTFIVCGVGEPLSSPAALRIRRAAGGVLVMKVNERSSYTEISTGTTFPRWDSVAALYCLTNSMMLTPC